MHDRDTDEGRAGERGQAMVEFAVAAPVLVLLLFGIMQFGILFYTYIDLTSATREGARKAAVSRQDATPAATTIAAVRNATSVVNDTKNTVTVVGT